MKKIQQRDLRNDSGKVLAAVEAGESFTITRNGKPVAELRPLTRRTFVPVAELARTSARLPRVDYAEWRADMDAMLDQELPDRE
ncbi:type II toxin-antitoxin system prevent-host-death family antitoxin [Nocardia cyriacigeorgica]|uniref:type II toxin-antitoxin system Phd/YefM family antitoxin n=1 Tax=Nocardia cyriacigeorgica TaxID=135487 RepID=UPI001895E08C|nr:type II toxin-antitoxin system prevent-host-death family antitoxin [Nocardia cyriacigeorgica]MBF6100937.1 type II toxin-antitoxin system prevent-host-death family antitoxin [Nocardia cyriacigeorgica]MBF6160395.1 type II toxin-antitoxin system prevent-host-death family antitoxin [Nocardia cyriacigeorgica]MBF6199480.1 type II toxin-antitoxin system prevent-host-death family antitoxin [Nocardia cyriacigeorgica]MBF6315337.1 type II toxin-antitoxin system prevent-host-death family antitoxin [Noca